MKQIAAVIMLILTVSLSGCSPLGSLCLSVLTDPEATAIAKALCYDPLLRNNYDPRGTYCYCDHCGGIADDLGGVSGPHNYKNSSSHGPCPGIGSSCSPTGFSFEVPDGGVALRPDLSLPFQLPDLAPIFSALDMTTAPDLASPKPDMSLLPDMTTLPDMYRSCLARIQDLEGCRVLPEKIRQQCIDQVVAGSVQATALAACVDAKCPPGTLLRNACSNTSCDRTCCTALEACN